MCAYAENAMKSKWCTHICSLLSYDWKKKSSFEFLLGPGEEKLCHSILLLSLLSTRMRIFLLPKDLVENDANFESRNCRKKDHGSFSTIIPATSLFLINCDIIVAP